MEIKPVSITDVMTPGSTIHLDHIDTQQRRTL